jgi:allantoinase
MADFDLVLQGTVVLPERIVEEGYVAVRDGKIAEVGLGVPCLRPANAMISASR